MLQQLDDFEESVQLDSERDEGFTGPVDPSWAVTEEKNEEDKMIYLDE